MRIQCDICKKTIDYDRRAEIIVKRPGYIVIKYWICLGCMHKVQTYIEEGVNIYGYKNGVKEG